MDRIRHNRHRWQAEAEKRTETRLEELAEAQKKTEISPNRLIGEHSQTRQRLEYSIIPIVSEAN